MIHDEEYEKHYSPDGEHIEYLMENPQPTQPQEEKPIVIWGEPLRESQPQQEEWEQEWDRIAPASVESNGIVYDLQPIMIPLKQFIKNLISKIRKEERELIIRIIEEEKEVVFNSEKFYNGGEEVFGLLLKIQEKIKHL